VEQLCPDSAGYADAYDRFGMLTPRTVMAHVVYPEPDEIELLRERGVMVAHCPASNMNIRSGIAPVRRLLKAGVRVGLGTDVAGGQTIDMFRAVTDAVQVSKLYWRLIDQRQRALTLPEAFYLATVGGGAYFGKVGTFAEGYAFDAIVVDDSGLPHPQPMTVAERLERAMYLSGECRITHKYVNGEPVLA
jgi:guanine deaminase